jgi:ADP-ribosylglycohydrolase
MGNRMGHQNQDAQVLHCLRSQQPLFQRLERDKSGTATPLVDAISSADRQALLSARRFEGHSEIAAIADGRYCANRFEAALWHVRRAGDLRDAVLLAANPGNDADTVAAVTGRLAGAIWGEAVFLRIGLPSWRGAIGFDRDYQALCAWERQFNPMGSRLFARPP